MSHVPVRSARLYNKELAPESATNTWKTLNLFNWWMAGLAYAFLSLRAPLPVHPAEAAPQVDPPAEAPAEAR